MRLEVFCEDRLGLTRELLDLLVLRGIDLRGIDIDPIGRIYLNFAELEFASFSSLMAEIRRIAGVTDVRTVPWMPSEREHLALSALLVAMPEPVLSLDTKGKVELANPASCQLFAQSPERLRNHPVAQLITDFNVQRWLESSPQESHSEHVVVNGQNFVLEITPVYLEGEHGERVPDRCGGDAAFHRSYGASAANHDDAGHQCLQSNPRRRPENAPCRRTGS